MEFTIEELVPIAEQMVKLCMQKMASKENRQIMVLEDGLCQGMQALGGMVLARTLSQADQELGRELPC